MDRPSDSVSFRRVRRAPLLAVAALTLLASSACQVHEHRIGGGGNGISRQSARQYYLFFGLVQLNEVNVQRIVPDLVSYDIRSEFALTDLLLTPLLLPLTVTTRTVTVTK